VFKIRNNNQQESTVLLEFGNCQNAVVSIFAYKGNAVCNSFSDHGGYKYNVTIFALSLHSACIS
jgi:hypothetical protein